MFVDPSLLNLYVLVTLFCWGVWGILDKKALETSSHIGVLLRLYLMALWEAPLVYLIMVFTQPHWHINGAVWFWTFWAAVLSAVSFATYLLAMSITDASLVLGITAAYPIITQFLAAVFLHEEFIGSRLLGGIAISAGVCVIGSSHKISIHAVTTRQKVTLLLCLVLATLGWGAWGILDKLAVENGTPLETWLAECVWELVFLMLAISIGYARGHRVELKSRPAWIFACLSAICLAVGRLTFFSTLSLSSASYALTITGCYPLLMYLLATLFLKEKFDKLRLAGILLVVAGGIAVQFTQGV